MLRLPPSPPCPESTRLEVLGVLGVEYAKGDWTLETERQEFPGRWLDDINLQL